MRTWWSGGRSCARRGSRWSSEPITAYGQWQAWASECRDCTVADRPDCIRSGGYRSHCRLPGAADRFRREAALSRTADLRRPSPRRAHARSVLRRHRSALSAMSRRLAGDCLPGRSEGRKSPACYFCNWSYRSRRARSACVVRRTGTSSLQARSRVVASHTRQSSSESDLKSESIPVSLSG